ncbi:Bacterial regulatory protein, tetR family [compost metagenome]
MARRRGVALTREDVIVTAITLLRNEGPDALGINRVARELGIKPPSLYHHVTNNDDLHRAVALAGWKQLDESLQVTVQGADDPGSKLKLVAGAYRAFAIANPALYTLMSTMPFSPTASDTGPVAQRMIGGFHRMIEPLGLTPEQGIHAMRTFRAAIHGYVLLELAGQFGLPQSVNESFERMLETLFAAMRSSVKA